MKRMKKKNKMAAFLAAVILMTMSVCQGAFAGETAGIDTARPVSLTIDLEAESKKATISIYKVGEWNGAEGAYALSQEFTGSGADIGDHTATGVLSAAQTLEQFMKKIIRSERCLHRQLLPERSSLQDFHPVCIWYASSRLPVIM